MPIKLWPAFSNRCRQRLLVSIPAAVLLGMLATTRAAKALLGINQPIRDDKFAASPRGEANEKSRDDRPGTDHQQAA